VHFTHDAIAGNSPYRDENLRMLYRWVPKADIAPPQHSPNVVIAIGARLRPPIAFVFVIAVA
jgi:hypothetical protein